jgi:rhodanese-related sulfurtransferase
MQGYTRTDLDTLRAAGRTVVLLDVRTAEEFARGSVPEARHLPADRLEDALPSLSREAVLVAVCNHGGSRSQGAAEKLRAAGFPGAGHLVGGVQGA